MTCTPHDVDNVLTKIMTRFHVEYIILGAVQLNERHLPKNHFLTKIVRTIIFSIFQKLLRILVSPSSTLVSITYLGRLH